MGHTAIKRLKAAGVPVYIIIQWENQYSPNCQSTFFYINPAATLY
jgi:hypothetical protein